MRAAAVWHRLPLQWVGLPAECEPGWAYPLVVLVIVLLATRALVHGQHVPAGHMRGSDPLIYDLNCLNLPACVA